MKEEWKDIAGYEGFYQVSNFGRVRRLKRWVVNKNEYQDHVTFLKPMYNGYGYLIVSLCKNSKRKNHYIHRLVAEAFIDNPNNKPVVNHIDFNKENNNVNNLEWLTQRENVRYSSERMKHAKRITHSNTGEKYISYRANKGIYRVQIPQKAEKTCKTLEKAILIRDSLLKRGVI